MGPLASFAHRHRVEAAVGLAVAEGGAVLAGGRRPALARLDAGAFLEPTVIAGLDKQLSISTPFGGFKDSGVGREKGVSGLRLYQQSKSLYVGLETS
jgi:acyl-CoA reductase-like NAD-dependent aldehyde dehydrogenase